MNPANIPITSGRQGIPLREWVLLAAVFAISGLVWKAAVTNVMNAASADFPDQSSGSVSSSELEVIFLDVGEGDSAFIRTPGGHTILVDGGPGRGEYSRFDAGQQVIVPFLRERGITHLDTILLTHPHADHYGGLLSVMDSVSVGEFLDPGMPYTSFGYEAILKKVSDKAIPYRVTHVPAILSWDPQVFVQVLWPEPGPSLPDDPNNNSIVFRLVHGSIVYTFTGDMEAMVEQQLYPYGNQLRTTVLKVPHHGSATSSTQRFLELLAPRLAVFPCGYNNSFGHPDREVLERYRNISAQILRTDNNGTIRTFSNGNRVKVIPDTGTPFTLYPFPGAAPENSSNPNSEPEGEPSPGEE